MILSYFLQRANDLVRNKIHPTSIISGYRVSYSCLTRSFHYRFILHIFSFFDHMDSLQ